ncbi:hypothetical protein [Dysgonomonas sp. 25]|uniref:hypothetical protein n=1 Tax=Dysgonomonas sp. 25 TaxID=2302933 RepID=UPI0013D1D691|nr:hypothetical protein [Dysgonomonas sp. 25]NDV69611.1 hypothetical protein [Dysgonomonas sp. 25]
MKKYIFLFFIFILFSGCRFGSRAYEPSEDTNTIMSEYPWYLDMDTLTMEQANTIFASMEADTDLNIDLSKVVIDAPKVKIQYFYKSFLTKESFILKADNGENFTAREILFKINEKTSKNLKGHDHVFFEGLGFLGYEGDMPVYEIHQGS